jgi:hypothetical protein
MEKIIRFTAQSVMFMLIVVWLTGCKTVYCTISGNLILEGQSDYNGITVVTSGKTSSTLSTDANGNFSVQVQTGRYTVSVGKEGFESLEFDVAAHSEDTNYSIGPYTLETTTPPGLPDELL